MNRTHHDQSAPGREESVTAELERLRIVPVVVIHDPDRAVPLAKALMDGGLPCAEITFRTPGAPEALRRIAAEFPDVFVGAGQDFPSTMAPFAFLAALALWPLLAKLPARRAIAVTALVLLLASTGVAMKVWIDPVAPTAPTYN